MSADNKPKANARFYYYHMLLAVLVPLIIYVYFLRWRTGTVYGDDLYIFQYHESLQRLYEKINMPVSFGKYRPVHGLNMHLLIELFQKNIGAYYVFNIAIQTVNALLFAFTANIFLRSFSLSLLFGLAIGLSRFSLFNVVQLLNGGALEGMAMSFFLAALFFLVRALAGNGRLPVQQKRDIYLGIVFANLSMYTHERYIVLLPFIILLVLLYPALRQISVKQRAWIIAWCLGSIVLNVVLKKQLFNMSFFMGTASTGMEFSLPSAMHFLTEGILSIFQFNTGPEFLTGITFTALPVLEKLLVLLVFAGVITTLFFYIRSIQRSGIIMQGRPAGSGWLIVSLIVLFGFFLVPAVLTIRLEQRWLQASWSIFMLLFIIAFTGIPFRSVSAKNGLSVLFCLLVLWVDGNYLKRGGDYIYLNYSEKAARQFETAIQQGIIKPATSKIYIWEKHRDSNTENAIRWDLGDGYFFNFYQQHPKKLVFVDSVYKGAHLLSDTSFAHFNRQTDQVLYLDSNITDITHEFAEDSLEEFSRRMYNSGSGGKEYFSLPLLITAANLEKFGATGFYENENGIRWTNGNAVIAFAGSQQVKDSLQLILTTYMPGVCKNIVPKVMFTGRDQKKHMAISSGRVGDVFTFMFYFDTGTKIESLEIMSEKIPADAKDQRVLSFPFKSIEVK